jgi:hypothetical protein
MSQPGDRESRNPSGLVLFHPDLFVETLSNLSEALQCLTSKPFSNVASMISLAQKHNQSSDAIQELKTVALNDAYSTRVKGWNQAKEELKRLRTALNNGNVESLACRNLTRQWFSMIWEVTDSIHTNLGFSGEQDEPSPNVYLRNEILQQLAACEKALRELENVEFATPEEETAYLQRAAVIQTISEGNTKSSFLADLLEAKRKGVDEKEFYKNILASVGTTVGKETKPSANLENRQQMEHAPQAVDFENSMPESLGTDDLRILKSLNSKAPLRRTLYDIVADTEISRKTVGIRLNKLIERNLACRPDGERKGATITDRGQEILKNLPAH